MIERLQNILAHRGVASRRKSAEIIAAGRVTVDGVVVNEPGAKFEDTCIVKVDGKILAVTEALRTIVMYKPVGVLSTMSDPFGGKTVADILYREQKGGPLITERLVPVGRLDKDSEGLLLLSNDGTLINELTHPRYEHRKTYLVRVAGYWNESKLMTLRSPLTLNDGYTIRPVNVELIKAWENNTRLLKFTLGEGRKRQIRQMCSLAHLVVLSLKRVAIGKYELPKDLQPGQWRELTPTEIQQLRQ